MKFALASWGSRGEVEPFAAVGRELSRRGHDVRIAVAPDLVSFAESAGLAAIGYGPDLQAIVDAYRDFWTRFFGEFWKVRDLIALWREIAETLTACRPEISATLRSLADRADVLITGMNFEDSAANVGEYHAMPLATLHWFPMRPNGQLVPFLPGPLGRSTMTVLEWLSWLGTKKFEDAQRRDLGLPRAASPWPRRIINRGALEIQAYDEACFPGLAAEWAKWNGQRPFVGALTLQLPTDADDEVGSWIAAGTPPIFFGFGSIPVESPADTLSMIGAACAQLGERALLCGGLTDFSQVPRMEHVKVVDTVNFAAIFPACRAVVHHGGAGTTAVGLRAGVPTLILSTDLNQTLWGAQIKRLKVGTARRFSAVSEQSLVADLRTILAPDYVDRARELAGRMSKPAESVTKAADLIEDFVRGRGVGCG
jgi:UDP:flavonoid glycosyltransferase YjiC (YdhE family)